MIRESARKKRLAFDLDAFLEKDARLRKLRVEIDDLRAKRNQGVERDRDAKG